ncbi:MAG: bifunctional transaldolase/phosoglucose isomerase [Verrucomicrobiae bacterium]|nr:bifunctional transaldolase/phosoglucose isomerase [Verrucomicrobiae bacterium]
MPKAEQLQLGGPAPGRYEAILPENLARAVTQTLKDWRKAKKVAGLWAGDARLWTGADEAEWLGWLSIVDKQLAEASRFAQIAADARSARFTHVLLLGMGGSSLCPEVLSHTFGHAPNCPKLIVLDSTDPAQVKSVEGQLDLNRTLFIVSSKSGTTVEADCLRRYFFARASDVAGAAKAPQQFAAITDPGSPLDTAARINGFRRAFYGARNIGGRFSALSDFGMVPAALIGVDVPKLLSRASAMARTCKRLAPERNPGAALGAILGAAHNLGMNKLTLVISPGIQRLGAWLEQLLAESTGKDGKAIIPIEREELQEPDNYGPDRLFVYIRLASAPDAAQDAAVTKLEEAGHPVVRIHVPDIYGLGAEFFRWEFATAVAGAVIGINPFNQPDVESSKAAARKFTARFEETGQLPADTPLLEEAGLKLFAPQWYASTLARAQHAPKSLDAWLRAHFAQLCTGDYFALLAFIQMTDQAEALLQQMRLAVLKSKRVATSIGFGPRYLHSTGQAHKGGPNTGLFLMITCDDALDLPVPGRKYSFGILKAAQACGDFEVLAARNRRILRVHLPAEVQPALVRLRDTVLTALS